jgi:NADH-quinone oxidoreductase subunit M
MPDLDARELWLLAPIAACVLWMGIYPESFLRPMREDVARLLTRIERATPPSDSKLTPGKPIDEAPHGETSPAPAEAH